MPFATAWVGENHFAAMPMVVYCLDLCMCALAYTVLQFQIIRLQGQDSVLHQAVGSDFKGKVSLVSYVLAIPLALVGYPWLSGVLVGVVACIWFIPDRRIEKRLMQE
jgi:uncharacterized membrane protein